MLRSLVLIAIALAAQSVVAPSLLGQRPLVLLVHGRGHLARDTAALRRDVVLALREGSSALTGNSLLQEDDVRLVWYADVLDGRNGLRADTTTACSMSANGSEHPAVSIFSMLAMLVGAFDANAGEQQKQEREGLRSFAGDLRFLGDARTRCSAEGRLAQAIGRAHAEKRPTIIVAHSLGALVSWGYFQGRSRGSAPLNEINSLVTLGSPIGAPGIRELVFRDTNVAVRLPKGVGSWVNVINDDDPFAVPLEPASGQDVSRMTGIVDARISRRSDEPHELRGYLRDSVTTRAILQAWCDAFVVKSAEIRNSCSRIAAR